MQGYWPIGLSRQIEKVCPLPHCTSLNFLEVKPLLLCRFSRCCRRLVRLDSQIIFEIGLARSSSEWACLIFMSVMADASSSDSVSVLTLACSSLRFAETTLQVCIFPIIFCWQLCEDHCSSANHEGCHVCKNFLLFFLELKDTSFYQSLNPILDIIDFFSGMPNVLLE